MPSTRSNQPPSKNWKKMARKQQGAEAKWDLTLEIHKSLGSLGRVGILSGSSAMAAPAWPSTHHSTSLETANPGVPPDGQVGFRHVWCKQHQASQKPPEELQDSSAVGTGKAGFPLTSLGRMGRCRPIPKRAACPSPRRATGRLGWGFLAEDLIPQADAPCFHWQWDVPQLCLVSMHPTCIFGWSMCCPNMHKERQTPGFHTDACSQRQREKMPLPRNAKMLSTKQSRAGKVGPAAANPNPEKPLLQEESCQAKRSPSSPQGGPKKRSAFGDITNAHKNQVVAGKKEAVKVAPHKAQRAHAALGVAKNNEINLKKSMKKTPTTEAPTEPKEDPVEELVPAQLPAVEDIDKEQLGDPYANAEYAKEIFEYMREREEKFMLPDYMAKQPDISGDMRAILVDWMVEVQENFELNHETLYLAVKLVDHYLVEVVSMRDKLQLIGSTAILIASKFEERCPPCVDDFLYICDDAYKREELIAMEMSILSTLKFDINIPIPYRFLRRFAKCARATMETLTLARFLCEMTLQEYDYARESPSKLAASCLLLALTMKNLGGWTPTLEYYSGYRSQDLHPLVKRLNFLLTYQPHDKLKAVRTKYSHRVFFEVAKVTPMDMLKLEEILKSC
ncbi:G2/mitotic-specific cyclin-B3 isoform X3 [Accipiter gentilis]|uniref:G2/mitotic-specific cyclin-B3 isoform X3 n=1 Tax=Astur gentilis TaxID=8957 RepID=UPI00210FB344|nr:G2/mitotic-specific cyclin-B3 isoform X3 [Accipiter gentilis]